jgi:O-antigen/teichoic acid export membrane protein
MAKQRSLLNSVKWAYSANWGQKAFSSVITVVLAGLLGPREFGIITIALIYVSFIQMFLDQGFGAALIQRKDLRTEHLDAVFWMDVALSLGLIGLSIACSRWWAAANHIPQLSTIVSVLSLCILFEGLAVVQTALLKREMDFKSLSVRTNASVLLGGCCGIAAALMHLGVWALVVQEVVRDLAALILLWRLGHWRPRLEFSWKHLRELMGFSVSNFVAQLAIFTDGQTGAILLGTLFGPVAVGLYRLADRLTSGVIAAATSSIQSVALPEFSRLQESPGELQASTRTFLRLSSSVTLPALGGLAAVSGPLMAVIGQQWVLSSDVLKILCVTGMISVLGFFTGPLLQALNRPHHLAVLEWTKAILGASVLVIAALLVRHRSIAWDIAGIAWARFTTTAVIMAPVFLFWLIRLSKISARDLFKSLMPSLAATAIAVGAVSIVQLSGLFLDRKPIIALIAEILAGATCGLTVLLYLDHQLRTFVVGLTRDSFRRRVAAEEPA